MTRRNWLVTGGAGFIGSNLANRLLRLGHDVVIVDNLYRPGVERNLEWLRREHGAAVVHHKVDVRDFAALAPLFADRDVIVHTAGQTAVTTSLADPLSDFALNAQGTVNCLEAARRSGRRPVFLITSTNKVYGDLESVGVEPRETRWVFKDRPNGIDESQPLDFYSPYGCSKGAADQYTRDYHRIYGLPAIVFRMSCQLGPRQFGTEDQGWVAHFVFSALRGRELAIYGDGKQIRDILYIEDLLDAMLAAVERVPATAGEVFNIGGGPENAVSLLELLALLEKSLGRRVERRFAPGRPGDQKVFISDIRKARRLLGWAPRYNVEQCIERLLAWGRELDAETQALA